MRKLLLLILFPVIAYSQSGTPRVRVDTLVSFTPASFVRMNDSLQLAKFIEADSTGFPIAPSFGKSRLVFRGDSGIYYWDGNSRWRLDTNYTGTFALKTYVDSIANLKVDTIYRTSGKDSIQFTLGGRYHAIRDSVGNAIRRVLESDGTPSIAGVDSLEISQVNGLKLTNPSTTRAKIELDSTSTPTLANLNVGGYVGLSDNQISFSGGNLTFNGFNTGGDVYFTGLTSIQPYQTFHIGASGILEGIPDVALGQVFASQGTTTAPQWSASPTLTGLTLSGLSPTYYPFVGSLNQLTFATNSLRYDSANSRNYTLGTLNVGGTGTSNQFRVDGTSFLNGLSSFQNGSNLTISKWLAQNGNGIASFYADTNGSNYSQLNLFPPKDSGRTGVSFWFRHADSAVNLSYRAATIQAHDLRNSDDSTHKHFSIYVRAGTDSTNHAVDWYHSDQWDNQMKVRSSVGIKDSLGIKLGSGNNDVHSSKAFSIGDGGTDVYSMETASDRLRFYNDASPPVEIMSVDSAATFYGTLGNFGGGAVQIGGTTASIIIDGADGSEVAGTNKIYENAHISISSRNGIFAKIDNDNNSTSQLFGVTTNGSATTVWEVGEGGLISKYGTIATVSNGVPSIYAKADSTAQAAAIATTTLYAVPASGAGQYRVQWNAKVTTAATSSSTLGALTIVYTDPDNVVQTITCGAQTNAGAIVTTSTGNSTTTVLLGVPMLLNCKASTNITYAFAYTSSGATAMQYNFHINLEKL